MPTVSLWFYHYQIGACGSFVGLLLLCLSKDKRIGQGLFIPCFKDAIVQMCNKTFSLLTVAELVIKLKLKNTYKQQ